MAVTLIALDLIHENGHNVRRTAASAEQDAELQASIGALGILQPVLLRADPEQLGRYLIVAGHRRVRCARAAAFTEIPAEVLPPADHATYAAIQTAENVVRVPMDPVDQWRSIVTLQEAGYTLQQAAAALGIGDRRARQLDKLGHITPEILDIMVGQPLPGHQELAAIASAPAERQAAALERTHAFMRPAARIEMIARQCTSQRISRAHAIFEVEGSGVYFDEDLFAEPGSEDQFTTADTEGFVAAQKAALEAQVAERAKKENVALGTWSSPSGNLKLPKRWERTYSPLKKRYPKKGKERLFLCVREDGYAIGQILQVAAIDYAKPAEKPAAGEAGGDGTEAESSPPAAVAADAEEAIEEALTKRGQSLLAVMKTAGLCRRLAAVDESPLPLTTLCAALIVAIAADNVTVNDRTDIRSHYARAKFLDLVEALVGPGGTFVDHGESDVACLAAEALSRMLRVTDPTSGVGSGRAAEWIGTAIGADAFLPRFDTTELLACMSKAALADLAAQNGRTGLKTAAGLRQALEGSLPDWRPVTFGAPGPVRAAQATADQDGEEAEAA